MRVRRLALTADGARALIGTATYVGLVTGRRSLDLDAGRPTRPLGPLVVDIATTRDVMYPAATAPYALHRPRAGDRPGRERTPRPLIEGAPPVL